MHLASLAARNDEARRRIQTTADALRDALGIAPLGQPSSVEQRQPAVAQMRELEEVASFLEAIAAALEVTTDGKERPRPS